MVLSRTSGGTSAGKDNAFFCKADTSGGDKSTGAWLVAHAFSELRRAPSALRGEAGLTAPKFLCASERLLFARSDGARGANIGASAAIYADSGVDGVLFAFRDGAGGAFVDAGAASDAVVTNYVSHNVDVLDDYCVSVKFLRRAGRRGVAAGSVGIVQR